MKKIAVLIVAALVVSAGCRSGASGLLKEREAQVPRLTLARVLTAPEIQAEIAGLTDHLKKRSEAIYKDYMEGMLSTSINRLVEIGHPALYQLITEYYDAYDRNKYRHFRYLVVAILHRMQEPTSQKMLVWVLHCGDAKERRLAAEALWRFGDAECVPTLIAALDDDSLDVVNTAAAALHAITGRQFGIHRNITRAEREVAIQRWRHWWELIGHALLRGRADRALR